MESTIWFTFVIIAFVTTITPGPATMLTVSNSITFGTHRAFWTSLGNSIGLLFVSTFVMLGLGVALKTSATIFLIFKLVGAFYLIYLGAKQLRNKQSVFSVANKNTETHLKNNSQLFMQGILIAVTNPKAIIFFFGFFPQFITQKEPILQQFVILTVTFSVCAIISHLVYLILLTRIRRWFSNLKRVKLFNRTVGGIFIFLGLSMLWIKRS